MMLMAKVKSAISAPLKSLDRQGRVLYAGTFSKTLFPALRMAYLVVPAKLCEEGLSLQALSDWQIHSAGEGLLMGFANFTQRIDAKRAVARLFNDGN